MDWASFLSREKAPLKLAAQKRKQKNSSSKSALLFFSTLLLVGSKARSEFKMKLVSPPRASLAQQIHHRFTHTLTHIHVGLGIATVMTSATAPF